MAVQPQDLRLLSNLRFRRLLGSRVIGQTAQNALLYTLLILVVAKTDSSVQSTLLIIAFTLPSIILGIPAGAVADILPKRLTLTVGYLLRAAVAGALIVYSGDVWTIFLLAAALSTVGQFFLPAEAASVPAIIRREQLPAANALMVFTLIMGQVAGMVILAPLLFKLIGADAVFVVVIALFLVATWVVAQVPMGRPPAEAGDIMPSSTAGMMQGFRILRTNRQAYLAVVYLVTATALTKVLVILLPKYTRDVLNIAPEDTVFVAAPAAIGAALGLLLAPPLSRAIGSWRVAGLGFALFLLGMIGLGLIVYVRAFLIANLDLGITLVEDRAGISSVITVAMILAIPLGLAFSLVSVGTRAVLNEATPQQVQGRVFAVQMAAGDFLSLLPLLIVGAVADLAGVRATLLVVAIGALALTGYLTFSRRFGPPPPTPAPGPPAGLPAAG
ncbi:MAG: MFS transporter [Dehalococcoidia bacterium]